MISLLLAGMTLLVGAEPVWQVKPLAEEPPAKLAEKIRAELDSQGLTVLNPEGETIAKLWFRQMIPARATAEQVKNGLSYREIPEGTLLGAVEFPKQFIDTRKQEIPAGVYTLRFAVQPEIGDHTGTSPHPDFALLSPAEEDPEPNSVEVKNLLKRSRVATGGDHPAVMLLFPVNAKETATKIVKKESRFQVLQVARRLTLESGDDTPLTFALTIDGYSNTR